MGKLIINWEQHEDFIQGQCGWRQRSVNTLTCKLPNMTFHWKCIHQKLSRSHWQTNSHIHSVLWTHTQTMWTVNSLSPCCKMPPVFWGLFRQVVTGVETGRLWYCFWDAPGRWPIGGEVQGGAVWSGPDRSPTGPRTCCRLDPGLIHLVPRLENSGHGGLHPAGLVNTGLGLKVASGLEFQAFIRASRDAGAEAKGLFKASTKPAEGKDRLVLFSLVYVHTEKQCDWLAHAPGLKVYLPIQESYVTFAKAVSDSLLVIYIWHCSAFSLFFLLCKLREKSTDVKGRRRMTVSVL